MPAALGASGNWYPVGLKISVIIPTKDEELALPATLGLLRRTASPGRVEVIVCDGGSRDRTVDLARLAADRVLEVSGPCRARQMQAGALAASGDLLLFLHADTLLPDDWEGRLLEAWSGPDAPAATAFRLGFDGGGRWFRFLAWAADLRTSVTGVAQGDQAIAVRREVFLAVGGFPPEPLMEEYLLFRALRPLGPLRVLPARVRTSRRRYEAGGRLKTTARNLLLLALFHFGVAPRTLARLYR